MKEILLCKYGEIVLKGANRKYFEDMLCREMKKRARAYGDFDVYRAQSTIYIEPKDDMADMDGMFAFYLVLCLSKSVLYSSVQCTLSIVPFSVFIVLVSSSYVVPELISEENEEVYYSRDYRCP